MLFTVIFIPRSESTSVSKRVLSLVALASSAFVLFATVVHACSDLSAMQGILKAPCDHSSSQGEPRSKSEKDNCDAIRYGMLSIQTSPFQTDLFKLYSIPLDDPLIVSVLLPDTLSLLWRSQGPPFSGLGVLPQFSRVVLRI